jgi:hypothetical protein
MPREMVVRPVRAKTWFEQTQEEKEGRDATFIGWTWQHAQVRLSF